jgi:hypothetical protein
MKFASKAKGVVCGWGSPTRRMSFGGSQLASIRLAEVLFALAKSLSDSPSNKSRNFDT